jgi:helix-turn-helix protein
MAQGRKTSLTIRLTPAERHTLLAWQRATTVPAGLARRGRIILLLADGVTITDTAATVGISRRFVYKWAQRFLDAGLEGLADKPGRRARSALRYPPMTEQHNERA